MNQKTSPNTLLQKAFIESHVDKLPPHKAIFVKEDDSCEKAIETMIAEKIGCLLVGTGGQSLTGIFTERDVLLKLLTHKRPLSETLVSEVMTSNPQTLKYHSSIAKAVYLMAVGGFRHIPIILKDKSVSVISATDFIRFIFVRVSNRVQKQEDAEEVVQLTNAVDQFFDGEISLLTPTAPLIVTQSTTVLDVATLMASKKSGCVVIGDPKRLLVEGLFTERDIVKKFILHRDKLAQSPILDFMTPHPTTLQPTASVLYALDAMTQGKFRHIPIVDSEEKLTGILSIKNFFSIISRDILSDLQK